MSQPSVRRVPEGGFEQVGRQGNPRGFRDIAAQLNAERVAEEIKVDPVINDIDRILAEDPGVIEANRVVEEAARENAARAVVAREQAAARMAMSRARAKAIRAQRLAADQRLVAATIAKEKAKNANRFDWKKAYFRAIRKNRAAYVNKLYQKMGSEQQFNQFRRYRSVFRPVYNRSRYSRYRRRYKRGYYKRRR